MSEFGIRHDEMEDKAAEMRSRVAGMVTQSFASAPAAAQAVAGANRTYMSSLAMMANFAQTALAIKKLFDRTGEHADLIQTTSQQVQQSDAQRALQSFNADAILPPKRPGSSNV
jgi:hypothetical protein